MKFALFASMALGGYVIHVAKAHKNNDTVKELDLGLYLGEWYEVASSPLVRALMERGGSCQKAVYTARVDGKFDVLNLQRKAGKISFIAGSAELPDLTIPGKLIIDFGFKSKGDYWVLALGPIVDGQYQWSVVSEPKSLFMWVLARDPQVYLEKYESTVKPLVTEQFGFNKIYNQYLERTQVGCAPFIQ